MPEYIATRPQQRASGHYTEHVVRQSQDFSLTHNCIELELKIIGVTKCPNLAPKCIINLHPVGISGVAILSGFFAKSE